MDLSRLDLKRRHLLLPDGRVASDLRYLPLYTELERMNLPITGEMGKAALLDVYEKHVMELVDANVGSRKRGARHPHDLDATTMQRAARVLAGMPFEGLDTGRSSTLPHAPIASTRV